MMGIKDHPRSRGVYRHGHRPSLRRGGSSPLARGLLQFGSRTSSSRRIIPARAGFTCVGRIGVLGVKDHPRSRGVYGSFRGRAACGWGSSPLARGLLLGDAGPAAGARIIPARAGFTVIHGADILSTRDHPRSRGVYPRPAGGQLRELGSSPLARGLLDDGRSRARQPGIIPARAGFTAHILGTTQQVVGSSPLARGLLRPAGHRR